MAKRILVPLDKTAPSEEVLPLVAHMARSSGGTVRLLHVAPLPTQQMGDHGRVIAYADQEMARVEAEVRDYLEPIGVMLDGVPTETVVRYGNPVDEILIEAEAFGADLITLTTRRRGWLPALHRISRSVLRKAQIPVLLLRTT